MTIVGRLYLAATVATIMVATACQDAPLAPEGPAPSLSTSSSNVYTSGAHVDTWNAIVQTQIPAWGSQICVPTPAVALNDPRWVNPHKAFVANGAAFRSWTSHIFVADWVNSWPGYEWYGLTPSYGGPQGTPLESSWRTYQQSWTRYSTPVSGNGNFVVQLAADNCSWIYITNADGSNPQLVGVQLGAPWVVPISYPVTLNGNHLLQFIVFDGGGQSGGMFKLQTTSIVFTDTDGDGLADVSETNIHLTNPNDPDTDDDGINDGDEVAAGTNPRVADVVDTDRDGIRDDRDNCPAVANADQANFDGDGQGDACDADDDNDGVPDTSDAFPRNASESVDTDGDGIGNNADTDDDNDGVSDAAETARGTNPLKADTDGDGVNDGQDAFPLDPRESRDSDGDGIGDNADAYDSSDTRAQLYIGTCNTGVGNKHLGNGTWWSDLIRAAQASAANHGKFVSAVSDLSNDWKKAGLISGAEHGAIVSCAARSK